MSPLEPALLPPDESARLAALHELKILDTAPERLYDDVVAMAAMICDTPIAIINFVDKDRQWGKALVGLDSSEAPRDASFCARTILQHDGLLVVPDTLSDPEWATNPQVVGQPGLRFYAGAAIVTEDGHALGSVCVADNRGPRELDEKRIETLQVLARQTASHLALRRRTSELADANLRLHEMTIRDGLTGLANRAFFEETLDLALRQRIKGRFGVLFCDMNGFKQVNDRLGHAAGDQLLQITAARMQEASREGDLVARLAGDEFVVLCLGLQRSAELSRIAERLIAAVARPATIAGTEVVPRITVGSALAHADDTRATLLRRADAAMYQAKPAPPSEPSSEPASAAD